MGINLDVGIDTATVNFTDSVSNTHTKYIEIGANGATSLGDALLVTHCSGSGVGYFGYESGNDRLIIACDNGGGNNKIDLCVNAGTATGGSTDNINAATPALRVHGNGNVGIHGVTTPIADLHVGNGGQEWRTSHGGTNLYVKNSGTTFDPQVVYGAPQGVLVTSTSTNTTGPDKHGLVLYNNDTTAGGFSPMLCFSKSESGSSPYKATMAAIYAKAPLGTGNSNSWIDGELIFATSGAASQGVTAQMVLDKEGRLYLGKANFANRAVAYAGQYWDVDGTSYYTKSSGNGMHFYDTSNYKFYVIANGGIYNYSGNNVNLSDERVKKNIEPLESQWAKVKLWNLKKFHLSLAYQN